MSAFDILPYRPDLLSQVAEAYVAIFNGSEWNERWTQERAEKRLQQVIGTPDSMGFVAVDDQGAIVGFTFGVIESWDVLDQCYIKELAVCSGHRGQGVGSALLNRLTKAAFQQHATQMVVDTNRDIPAYGMYQRRGYVETERVMLFRSDLTL